MKSLKYFLGFAFLLVLAAGCKKETYDDVSFVDTANSPDQLSVLFEITQDNTGRVTITPNGAGAVSYDIYYGDGTATPAKVQAGKNTIHTYAEGVYNVKIVAYSINGKTTEITRQLTVSFRAPENLDVVINVDPANNYKINVSATALYETNFRIYFGDVPNETPVSFLEGATVSHTYAAVGTYTVRVVALSGGAATAEVTRSVTIVDPVLLPITFESPTVDYTFGNFGGGNVTIINNPQSSGINTSSRVGRMVKNPPEVWGGSVITLGDPIDFSVNKVFRMKVFSPRVGAKVLLKVENLTNGGISFEREATTTVANTWEDLVFNYAAINTAESYQKVVLIFELGIPGDGSANFTFLFDDIRLTNQLPTSLLTLPVTFDLPGVNYAVTDFGGNQSVDAVDPSNAANNVKKTTKPNGAETWAGTTIGSGFTSAIPFSATATQMSVRVYSPAAGLPIRLKVEDRNDNTRSVETEKVTTVANAWETLVFDFANQATGTAALNLAYTYNMASIFFNFGTAGDGKIFYWDDITFLPVNVAGIALPLDFESTTLVYTFTNFDGGDATVINNPQSSGINTSSKVGRMIKNAGQVWGGSWIGLASPIDFSTLRTFKMKVFSPRVGAKVLLKVENQTNGGISYEKEVLTTTANAWEELTFDFSAINTANSYQKIVLIFELGTMGDGSPNFTFLFDDIKLN
ncbi:MAG TPA: PKD domain-containing protein [Chitinophagaceae bacterium]|nr:PKD domain-containing protein [Chitinophagaceae bacterium]HQX72035.1 PKD domain-containing protein [Chitinophagaceae bacterium]HQZ73130.1 PKD domain-containing protein [Chitinophagaceae bacterium]